MCLACIHPNTSARLLTFGLWKTAQTPPNPYRVFIVSAAMSLRRKHGYGAQSGAYAPARRTPVLFCCSRGSQTVDAELQLPARGSFAHIKATVMVGASRPGTARIPKAQGTGAGSKRMPDLKAPLALCPRLLTCGPPLQASQCMIASFCGDPRCHAGLTDTTGPALLLRQVRLASQSRKIGNSQKTSILSPLSAPSPRRSLPTTTVVSNRQSGKV